MTSPATNNWSRPVEPAVLQFQFCVYFLWHLSMRGKTFSLQSRFLVLASSIQRRHRHMPCSTSHHTRPHSNLLLCNSHTSTHVGLAKTINIYGVFTVILAGKSPITRSYKVYIYGSGQPYTYVRTHTHTHTRADTHKHSHTHRHSHTLFMYMLTDFEWGA